MTLLTHNPGIPNSEIDNLRSKTVLIVPDLLGDTSVLLQRLPALERLAEFGQVSKLSTGFQIASGVGDALDTPEALYLGMKPGQGQLRQGPLTVAALGVDPPDRSTHFHLSLMSFTDGVVRPVSSPNAQRQTPLQISLDEQREVMDLAKKLNTKTLTIVEGEGLDHGLVWEGLGDLRTNPASLMDGVPIRLHLPEGDAEVLLRRFIDDSINLLSEIEMNQIRIDEDLPPLNLLWPWGEGIRSSVPNLALRRGEPAFVLSSSMRMQGLTRLAGYRHSSRSEFGIGTNTRFASIAEQCHACSAAIVLIEAFAAFRGASAEHQASKFEEAVWLMKELDTHLLTPLFDRSLTHPARICLLAPPSSPKSASPDGLSLTFETGINNKNAVPFDEVALDDRRTPTRVLWEVIDGALT